VGSARPPRRTQPADGAGPAGSADRKNRRPFGPRPAGHVPSARRGGHATLACAPPARGVRTKPPLLGLSKPSHDCCAEQARACARALGHSTQTMHRGVVGTHQMRTARTVGEAPALAVRLRACDSWSHWRAPPARQRHHATRLVGSISLRSRTTHRREQAPSVRAAAPAGRCGLCATCYDDLIACIALIAPDRPHRPMSWPMSIVVCGVGRASPTPSPIADRDRGISDAPTSVARESVASGLASRALFRFRSPALRFTLKQNLSEPKGR
jgi:hypothetical protein